MSVRIVAALLLCLVSLQPTPLVGAQTVDEVLLQGQRLHRRGEYELAQQYFADVAARFGAPRALVLGARSALANGDTQGAEAALQHVLEAYPGSDQEASALLALYGVRRGAGDCSGALRAIDAYAATRAAAALGPYVPLLRAMCLGRTGDWPGELAAARAALAIDGGGSRLARIEALERAAEASLRLGQRQQALELYNRSLELAGTRAYRAEMLFTTATVGRALGQDALARERFRAVVVDYAESARGPGALAALAEMDGGSVVSPLQAGTVRLNAREYRSAVEQLEQVDPSAPEAGAARLQLATALARMGDEDAARIELAALADADPAIAGRALLQLGQLQERAGELAKADATYQRMTDLAPERAAEALFRAGFVRFVQHDLSGAQTAWDQALGATGLTADLQAQVQYWRTKVLGAGSAEWQAALHAAAAGAPETWAGLRAQDVLASSGYTDAYVAVDESAEYAAWLRGQGTTPEQVRADVAALDGLWRADLLLAAGLAVEAGWEVEGAAGSYAATRDLARLSAVAEWAMTRDLPQVALRIGRQLRDLHGYAGLPRVVQKQVYPRAWGDLVDEQAARFGVDPLLMLALMRQESAFDPRAQSSAQAMGLTQVVPATGRQIASSLGHADFEVDDLFRPAVSVEFGTWYLGEMLETYRGHRFLALAAYNAGGGNVNRWVQRLGDDPDVLVELVPFAETQTYLRIVYDNYRHYVALYGR